MASRAQCELGVFFKIRKRPKKLQALSEELKLASLIQYLANSCAGLRHGRWRKVHTEGTGWNSVLSFDKQSCHNRVKQKPSITSRHPGWIQYWMVGKAMRPFSNSYQRHSGITHDTKEITSWEKLFPQTELYTMSMQEGSNRPKIITSWKHIFVKWTGFCNEQANSPRESHL